MYSTLMTSTAPAVQRNQVVHTSIVQCCKQSCSGYTQKKSQQVRVKIGVNCSPLNRCRHFADSLRRSSLRGNLQWGPETTGSDWTPVCSIMHKHILGTFTDHQCSTLFSSATDYLQMRWQTWVQMRLLRQDVHLFYRPYTVSVCPRLMATFPVVKHYPYASNKFTESLL